MTEYIVKILKIEQITHNVKRFQLEKPSNYIFTPGNATELSISGEKNDKAPFTFTCLADESFLEFTIKIYKERKGFTSKLDKLKVGDSLILREPWGTIKYSGPGVFIAGGAGITPFIAILRDLKKKDKIKGNKLFFSNKTAEDIIIEDELKDMLGEDCIFILSRENNPKYEHGRINEEYLKSHIKDFNQHFYVCGPGDMVLALRIALEKLGARVDEIVFEK